LKTTELITHLQYRLEDDTNNTDFNVNQKLNALNAAQRTLCNLLDNHYLTELETISTSLPTQETSWSGTNSSVCEVVSSPDSIRNGIVRVLDKSNNRFCDILPGSKPELLSNNYIVGDSSGSGTIIGSYAMVFANRVYVTPNTISLVDIWFLKHPNKLINDADDEPELDEGLHDILLDLAESELWASDNQQNRAQAAQNKAMAQIEVLNTRVASD
tara:strand:- start:650 stop:1294 length:645 start_codon:yes stop_codon:yes gene_type:complete